MDFFTLLKKQLTAFVEIYQTYFKQTFLLAVSLTTVGYVAAVTLAAYTDFDPASKIKPLSILSYFSARFSYKETYSLVDMVKTVFLFLISLFSLNLIRNQQFSEQTPNAFALKLTVRDIIYLFGMLVVCCLLDCALFRLEGQLTHGIDHPYFANWIRNVLFFIRINSPMLLLALTVQISSSKGDFNAKTLALLLISTWLFNEIAYEVLVLVRADIFGLILSPIKNQTYFYVLESALGIVVIASYFLGYCCAMTAPFKIAEDIDNV